MITEEMRLAVKRGAVWLDQEDPMWVEKVRLESLGMHSCKRCILGQVFDSYSNVVDGEDYNDDWAIAHGFRAEDDDGDKMMRCYDQLGVAWSDYIKETQ